MLKYFGCSWYPEHRSLEEDQKEARRMADAGFNLVRLGEFSWDRLEEQEDKFEFSRLKHAVDALWREGISVLLCTPTAAPPPWMLRRYPEILREENDHTHPPFDDRRNYCPTSPRYRERIGILLKKLGEEFSSHPAVIGWQIDNELGLPQCFCRNCQQQFREYLKQRFGTPARFNDALWRGFWSSRIHDWSEVSAPFAQTAGRTLWNYFYSEIWKEFIGFQTQILQNIRKDWSLTTNSWAGPGHPVKASDLCFHTDQAGYDCYCNYFEPYHVYRMTWDYYRGLKPGRPFRVLETSTWNQHAPWPDSLKALRVWAWSMFAHGADTILYFPWRQSPMGEEDHPALLPWEGTDSLALKVVQGIGMERKRWSALQKLPLPKAEVVLLFSQTAMLAGEQENRAGFLRANLAALHEACTRLGVTAEVRESGPFCHCKAVLLSGCEYLSRDTVRDLVQFVHAGGTVYVEDRLQVMDEYGVYRSDVEDRSLLESLFGSHALGRVRFGKRLQYETEEAKAARFRISAEGICGDLLERTELLESAEEPIFWTQRRSGNGTSFRIAGFPAAEFRLELLKKVFLTAGISVLPVLPEECEIISRGNFRFYFNASPSDRKLPDPDHPGRTVHVKAYEIKMEEIQIPPLNR